MSDNRTTKPLESVGWLFWLITCALLTGPAIYVARQLTFRWHPWTIPAGIGVVCSAFIAGFISWSVNSVLQYRLKRRRMAARKLGKRR